MMAAVALDYPLTHYFEIINFTLTSPFYCLFIICYSLLNYFYAYIELLQT